MKLRRVPLSPEERAARRDVSRSKLLLPARVPVLSMDVPPFIHVSDAEPSLRYLEIEAAVREMAIQELEMRGWLVLGWPDSDPDGAPIEATDLRGHRLLVRVKTAADSRHARHLFLEDEHLLTQARRLWAQAWEAQLCAMAGFETSHVIRWRRLWSEKARKRALLRERAGRFRSRREVGKSLAAEVRAHIEHLGMRRLSAQYVPAAIPGQNRRKVASSLKAVSKSSQELSLPSSRTIGLTVQPGIADVPEDGVIRVYWRSLRNMPSEEGIDFPATSEGAERAIRILQTYADSDGTGD